jgi:hypothetical protein
MSLQQELDPKERESTKHIFKKRTSTAQNTRDIRKEAQSIYFLSRYQPYSNTHCGIVDLPEFFVVCSFLPFLPSFLPSFVRMVSPLPPFLPHFFGVLASLPGFFPSFP